MSVLVSISALQPRHLVDLALGQVLEAEDQGERLEPLAHPVEDVDLLEIEHGDASAAVGQQLGESLGLQDAQRLAHRQPAGAEPGGDVVLTEPRAGGDLPGQDLLAQAPGRGAGC